MRIVPSGDILGARIEGVDLRRPLGEDGNDIATTHNAVADYRADEPRLLHRVQVMAALDRR